MNTCIIQIYKYILKLFETMTACNIAHKLARKNACKNKIKFWKLRENAKILNFTLRKVSNKLF